MASLSGTTPAATYPALIKFNDNSAISASLRLLSDGAGGATPLYLSASQLNIGGTGLINATLGVKGTGTTAATFSFRAENSTNTRSINFADGGILNFLSSATTKMSMDAGQCLLQFFSASSDSLTGGAVGIQYATGIANANGILSSVAPNESHTFRKVIQLDGGISANSYYTMSLVDSGATYTGTYQMLVVIPSVNLSGAGSKNVVGYTFKPTLTAFANTKLFGAVFESGGLLIGAAATSANASASLEVISTTQGLLPPRMTTVQKNAIATPAAGLIVYDTTLNKLCVYTTAWQTITSV